MRLSTFIQNVGDEKAAKLFKVKKRTAMSWRLGDRIPRPEQAQRIVKASPVTYEGIYAPEGKAA